MKTKKIFLFLLLVSFLLLSFNLSATEERQKEIVQKQRELKELEKRIQGSQQKKREAQKQEKIVAKELQKIESSLKARQKELSIYDWNLEKNKQEGEMVLLTLKKLTEKRNFFSACLREELRLRFKESLFLQFLIFPKELGELTFSTSLSDIVDPHLLSWAEKLDGAISAQEAERIKLEKYQKLEFAYKKTAEQKKKEVQNLSQKKKKLLVQFQQERKKQDKALQSYETEALSLKRLLKDLEREERQIRAFRGGSFRRRKGGLPRPVNGALVKIRYGEGDIYKGVVIKAPRGQPVICVAPGKVIYGDWFRGFGNMVIIDHGDGYTTLYAHLDEILVKPQEEAQEEKVIAKVGATGSLTNEPRLYFEIRRHGEPLEPLEWLGK